MDPSRREIAACEQLKELFRDLPPQQSCSYRGIAFDTYHLGYSWLAAGLRLSCGALGNAAANGLEREVGDYVKVWFPAPLGIDLFLRSRAEPQIDKNGLQAYFDVDLINAKLARRVLEGPLSAALLGLNKRYSFVEMRDHFIEFGPLQRTPEEIAADLDALIDALCALYTDSFDDDLVEPDLGPDAPFCFYCGFTVRLGSSVCPRCGERLDEDVDEDDM